MFVSGAFWIFQPSKMGILRFITLCLVILAGCIFVKGENNDKLMTAESRLYDYITSKNNPHIRPVVNVSETLRVGFGIALLNIQDLDEKKGALTTQVWFRMLWKDFHIRWDPAEFNGVDHIRIPIDKIWQPDLVLYNAAESGGMQYQEALAVVSSDGTVLYIPPTILKSTCSVDMTRFPFDEQTCRMKFGSWTYDGFKIDVDFYDGLEQIDLTDYIMSNEWELKEAPAQKNVKYYPCCEEPYPDLTFTLKLRRLGGLQSLSYVAPMVFMAILCPIVFLLPYSETQRFSLGGSLLICLAIFLSSFEQVFPSAHGSTPRLAQYYISVIVLLMLSIIMSAIITNIADRAHGPYAMPRILKTIFVDVLGKAFCVKSANYALMNEPGNAEEGAAENKRSANSAADWRAFARILDRFFFVVYVVLTVLLSLVFLL